MSENGAFVTVNGFKLFYRVFGNGENVLLCLHGGPGAMHDYLLPLGELGDDRVKVVLYDQLGCGKSERPREKSHYAIECGVEEVEGVRQALKLDKINLFGNSYGGALALQYALKYQRNIKKLIISSGLASVRETVAEMRRLKTLLPKEIQDTLAEYEATEDYQNPEYLKAVDVFYRNFLCRLPEWPEELARTMNGLSTDVYWTMNGPNEFTITGNLRDWDITARLPEIHIPTLVTVGRYDEVTPKVAETIHRGIPGSELVLFEKSAHVAMLEERERYLSAVRKFILSD
ncbi:MAG: proline iminopeptidase-family hydrolase [Candidatus Bathyarchaeia archaeon]